MTGSTVGEASVTSETRQRAHGGRRVQLTLVWLIGIAFGCLFGFLAVSLAYSTGRKPPGVSSQTPPPDHRAQKTTRSSETTAPFFGQVDNGVCYTDACGTTAKELHESINPVVSPCDNFQEYVCGRRKLEEGSALEQLRFSVVQKVYEEFNHFRKKQPVQPTDARYKAAYLLLLCQTRFLTDDARSAEVLAEFAKSEQLHLEGPPSNLATGPEDVLALHVHLSFNYMLGGLVHVAPSTPGCLSVKTDYTMVQRKRIYDLLSLKDAVIYLSNLAQLGSARVTLDLFKEYIELHNSVEVALVSGGIIAQVLKDPAMMHTKADRVVIDGIGDTAFADAVATKTPYPRHAAVDMDPMVPLLLAAVWREVGSARLYVWTSWSVLDQLAPYVEPSIARTVQYAEFTFTCLQRVGYALGVPLAAISILPSQAVLRDVRTTAHSVVECLTRNASRWLLPSAASGKDTKFVVGFPPEEDTLEKMNSRYESFLDVVSVNFLKDWLEVMKTKKARLNVSHVHFDPADVDILVSGDGLVVVPAGAIYALYREGDLPAINMGRLGETIGARFTRRFRLSSVKPKPQCLAPAHSKTEDVFETLLAYECTRHVLSASGDLNASAALKLPMHRHMTPARQLFVSGCYKRCLTRNLGMEVNCDMGALRRLRPFADAFACQAEEPACELP